MASALALSDAALYEAIAEKKTWALSALYDRYATVLYSLALNILKREKTSQEIVEKTFVTLWRKSTAAGQGLRDHVGTWLILLCRTLAVAHYRRQNHLAAPAVAVEQLAEWVVTFANGHPDRIPGAEMGSALREALEHLPPTQRSVMEMVFLRGMTPVEIAGNAGLTEAEVRAQVHHALIKMREQLLYTPT